MICFKLARHFLRGFVFCLIAAHVQPVLSQAVPQGALSVSDTSSNNTWIPVGFNKDRIASMWVQLKTYEALNENSFRLNAKYTNDQGVQILGRLDLNCKNKDFYFRPNGVLAQRAPWASVPKGSGIESIAQMYCRRTAAKADWGFTGETAYLWD